MRLNRRSFLAALSCACGLRKTGLPSFTYGTGKFVNFGKGTLAILHGQEYVVPGKTTVILTLNGKVIGRKVYPYVTGEVG